MMGVLLGKGSQNIPTWNGAVLSMAGPAFYTD